VVYHLVYPSEDGDMFILSDANPLENTVNDNGEGVGMGQWGVPGSCT
jgi:hypothetical protein